MSSNKKLLENALKAIREHPQAFEALEEYDRTRKLPKTIYRERLNITLDSVLLRKLRRYANKKGVPISRIIENLIKEELGLKN